MADTVVLYRAWLATIIATFVTVARRATTREPGKLWPSDLERLCRHPDSHCLLEMRPLLLELLHACELAYPARDRDGHSLGYSVVPAMLQEVPPPAEPNAAVILGVDASSCVCIHITLAHTPTTLMPRFMARLGGLCERVWHNGSVYRERAPGDAAAVVQLRMPSEEMDSMPVVEMTATGAWPYAFLHQLFRSLADLTITIHVAVVCPRCNEFVIDIADARDHAAHSVEMPCWVCKRRSRGFRFVVPVAGFVSWGTSVPDSERGSFVDAALERARVEVANGHRNAALAIKEASNVLMSWWHDLNPPSPTPLLWTADAGCLVPLCEHPYKPHTVDMPQRLFYAVAWLDDRHGHKLTDEERAYLLRCHNLANIDKATATAPTLPTALQSSLHSTCATHWASLSTKPLQQVVDPEDSSRRRWLCAEHAKEFTPPDSGVDLSFLRWLRVGVALECVAGHLATFLQARVEQWYSSTLTTSARACVAAAAEQAAAQERARNTQRQELLDAAIAHAFQAVREEVESRAGGELFGDQPSLQLEVQECRTDGKKPWRKWGKEPRTAVAMLFLCDWGQPGSRYYVELGSALRSPLNRWTHRSDWVTDLAQVARTAFAAHVQGSGSWQALVLDKAILMTPVPGPDSDSDGDDDSDDGGASEGKDQESTLPDTWHCEEECDMCTNPAAASSGVCVNCRGWAKALAAAHRKTTTADNWRNCKPHRWSRPDIEVAARAWEAAKAFMSKGCQGVTCAADSDFAALVNVIDFLTGLQQTADKPDWQPASTNKVLGEVLQPARRSRNRFAHNSRLAFDKEADVSECIGALLNLVQHLPLSATDKAAAEARLKQLLQVGLAPSTGTPDELKAAFETVRVTLEGKIAPVLALAKHMLERDEGVLEATMPSAFTSGTAAVPRATATGGAGRGAGAGGDVLAVVTRGGGNSSSSSSAVQALYQVLDSSGRQVVAYDIDALTAQVSALTLTEAAEGGDDDAASAELRAMIAADQQRCLQSVTRALDRIDVLQSSLASGYGLAVRMSGEAGQQRPHFEFRQRVVERERVIERERVVETVMTGTT